LSKELADAIDRNLTSPNEADQNLEAANVVDGLFAIARSLYDVARAIDKLRLGAGTQTASLHAARNRSRSSGLTTGG
jgi:hypothetical protein